MTTLQIETKDKGEGEEWKVIYSKQIIANEARVPSAVWARALAVYRDVRWRIVGSQADSVTVLIVPGMVDDMEDGMKWKECDSGTE